MTGNAGINGGHDAAPFVANLVKIGVANPTEKNLDLYIVLRGLAARDCGGSKR
jgi:hypothetical protein